MRKRFLKIFPLLSVGISAVVIALLIRRFNAQEIWISLKQIPLLWLAAAVLLSFAGILIRTLRWKLFLREAKGEWSLRELFPVTLAGVSLGVVTPGGVGEVGRAYFAGKVMGDSTVMFTTSLLDKWAGLMGAFLLGFWASVMTGSKTFVAVASVGLVLLTVLYGILQNSPFKWFDLKCRPRWGVLAVCLVLAVAGWLITYFQLFLMYRGLQAPLSLKGVYTVGPLLTVASLVPLTFSGIGSRDLMAVTLFQGMGVAAKISVAACLLFNVTAVIIPALCGAVVIVRLGGIHARLG